MPKLGLGIDFVVPMSWKELQTNLRRYEISTGIWSKIARQVSSYLQTTPRQVRLLKAPNGICMAVEIENAWNTTEEHNEQPAVELEQQGVDE